MKKALLAIGLVVISLTVFAAVQLPVPVPVEASHTAVPAKQLAFRNAMRALWEDHITWTRLYIVSAAADLPD